VNVKIILPDGLFNLFILLKDDGIPKQKTSYQEGRRLKKKKMKLKTKD
jgi:hypothetical protein